MPTYLSWAVYNRKVAQAHGSKQVEDLTHRRLGVSDMGTGMHVWSYVLKNNIMAYWPKNVSFN